MKIIYKIFLITNVLIALFFVTQVHANAADGMRYPKNPICLSISKDPNLSDGGDHRVTFTTRYTIPANSKAYLEVCFDDQTVQDQSWIDGVAHYGPPKHQPKVCAPAVSTDLGTNKRFAQKVCQDSYVGFSKMIDGTDAKNSIIEACRKEANYTYGLFIRYPEFHYMGFDCNKNNQTCKKPVPQPIPPGTNIAGLQWSDYTASNITRRWQVVVYPDDTIPPTSTPAPITAVPLQVTQGPQASDGGLQHGTQGFVTPTIAPPVTLPPPADEIGTCDSFTYDPYGKVFDAKTLEPVTQAKVVAYELANGVYSLVDQPEAKPYGFITGEDGAFAFIVSPGKYKVDVLPAQEKNPKQLIEQNPRSILETNFQNITGFNPQTGNVEVSVNGKQMVMYSNVYPLSNINYPEIQVVDSAQMRNLPVKAGLFESKLKLLAKNVQRIGSTTQLSGRSSHPLAKVEVLSALLDGTAEPKKIAEGIADVDGNFIFSFNDQQLAPTEQISNIVLTKYNDFNGLQKTTQTIEQVAPRFGIKGYAYDKSGKVLPLTRVGVYLSYSTLASFVTTSDNQGYFEVPPESMPREQFVLRYGDGAPTEDNILTVKDFLTQNKDVPQNTKTNNKSLGDFESNVPGLNNGKTQQDAGQSAKTNSQTQTAPVAAASVMMYVVILFMLLIGSALLGVYYIKKKHEPHNYEMEI